MEAVKLNNDMAKTSPSAAGFFYRRIGVSIVRMLEKPEYMGDTVNFRSHKESYKDKKAVKNSSDEILVFRNTHEPDHRPQDMVYGA